IVVKLRQRIKYIDDERRDALELVLGPLAELADRLKSAPPAETISLFQQHLSLAAALDAANPAIKGDGMFISKHADDFTAFLEEPLEAYVKKIKETAEWGGQLELQAISRAYHVDINILQADGRVEKIECEEDGDGSKGTDVWLAYYRHNFGLGEHYNALTKADNT
ncbi:MAG: hypothetical protein M1823_007884, partial [Watsoniomyces obsoletus]